MTAKEPGLILLFELRRPAIIALTVAVSAAAGSDVAFGTLKPLPLSARVIQRGELLGFGSSLPGGSTRLWKSAEAWVSGNRTLTPAQASVQIARLRKEGFKAVLVELLGSRQPGRGGISWVMELGSSAAARAELVAAVRDAKSHYPTSTPFPVGTIPGAEGFQAGVAFVGDNVMFADGPFVYLIGNGWVPGVKNPPPRSALIAAVTKLNQRVRGHPPA